MSSPWGAVLLRGSLFLSILLAAAAPGAFAQPGPDQAAQPAAEPAAEAAQGPLSISGDVTLASRYLFQGLDYSEGRAVFQPNASLVYRSITANVWGNYQVNRSEVNEIDLSLKAGHSFGALSGAVGYMNLQYPNRPDWEPSQEIFMELGAATTLSPTFSIHYDFDAGMGSYSVLGFSQPVGPSCTVATNLFYHDHYYGATGMPATEFKVSWKQPVGAYAITPALSYFATWANHDFRGPVAVPSNWLFGINVGRSF